jgi:hypothetical protein
MDVSVCPTGAPRDCAVQHTSISPPRKPARNPPAQDFGLDHDDFGLNQSKIIKRDRY